MARDLRRPAGPTLTFPAAGGTLPLEIPKDAAYKALVLHFSAAVTIGTATGPSAAGILDAVRAIRVLADGKLPVVNIDGISLKELNQVWWGSTVPETPALAAATGTYKATLIVPFAAPFFYDQSVSILPAVPMTGLKAEIDIGSIANLFTTPGTGSVIFSVDVETWEILDLAPALLVSPVIISQQVYNIVAAGSRLQLDLPDGNRIAQVLASARNDASGSSVVTSFPTGLINGMTLEHTAPEGGPTHLRVVKYQSDRDVHQIAGSGVFGGRNVKLTDGMMLFNFVADGRLTSPLDVSARSRVRVYQDLAMSGTNPRVHWTTIEIIPQPVRSA